jgi:hypothetical protein
VPDVPVPPLPVIPPSPVPEVPVLPLSVPTSPLPVVPASPPPLTPQPYERAITSNIKTSLDFITHLPFIVRQKKSIFVQKSNNNANGLHIYIYLLLLAFNKSKRFKEWNTSFHAFSFRSHVSLQMKMMEVGR